MSYQNKFIFSKATPKDSEGICELFKAQSFDGKIAVQYLRGEDPISSFLREGDDFICLVVRDAEDDNRIIGMGSCVVRKGYVEEKICNIGYLTGLKLLPEYHKKFFGIAKAYSWIYENTQDKVDYYYTTILADNIYVQNMLEKKRKNMPLYQNIGDYYTFIFKTGGFAREKKKLDVRDCSGDDAREFYIKKATSHLFSVADPTQNDLVNSRFFALYRDSEIVAVASVLDQRGYKQYIVKGYDGIYNLAKIIPTNLFGYPSFPKLNETVSLASAAIYQSDLATPEEIKYFFTQILYRYTDTELIVIGLHHRHPLFNIFTKFKKKVSYKSKLYRVSYNHDDNFDPEITAGVDVAFC